MILDTNALSAAADCDAAIEPMLRGAEQLAVPAIVLGEYPMESASRATALVRTLAVGMATRVPRTGCG